jgi:hypothetical protein
MIPKKYHPFICGPNHEKVNSLVAETGVRINVPPVSVMQDEIYIVGEKEGVAKAVQTIKSDFEAVVSYSDSKI